MAARCPQCDGVGYLTHHGCMADEAIRRGTVHLSSPFRPLPVHRTLCTCQGQLTFHTSHTSQQNVYNGYMYFPQIWSIFRNRNPALVHDNPTPGLGSSIPIRWEDILQMRRSSLLYVLG